MVEPRHTGERRLCALDADPLVSAPGFVCPLRRLGGEHGIGRVDLATRGASVATVAWRSGARGAQLGPPAPPHPQRHATDGSASPGFAPSRAQPGLCDVLLLEA